MDIVREEVFGPIACILRFSTLIARLRKRMTRITVYRIPVHERLWKVMRAVNELEFGEVFVNRVGPEAVSAHHTVFV